MIPGKYITSLAGHRTFIPDTLPPALNLPPKLLRMTEEAIYVLGQVETCGITLPSTDLLIYSSLQREAIASSTIEGTIASPKELVLFQVSHRSENLAAREVANYQTSLEWGFQQVGDRELTINFIRGLHGRLLQDVRGHADAGKLKDRQNAIGTRLGDTIDQALFVPCPPERVQELMEQLESYLHSESDENKIIQCALTHYQFETIHPFVDGNGRVGRLLIVLQLIKQRFISAPLIYPSVFFEKSRQEYYQTLQNVREYGKWEDWIEYFTRAIISACKETIEFTKTIMRLRRNLLQEDVDVRRKASYGEVLRVFFEKPFLTVREIKERTGLSNAAIQSALDNFDETGLVYEITGKLKGRVYACRPVVEAIFGSNIERQPFE